MGLNKKMIIAANASFVERIVALERKVTELTEEKDALIDENSVIVERIAEHEDIKNSGMKRETDALELSNELCAFIDKELPLLPIPLWHVRHIIDRIAAGERTTVYNLMYIYLYSEDNRFIDADKFRNKIVNAYNEFCHRFVALEGLPHDADNIPDDFHVVNEKLHSLATLNQHDYITRVFLVKIVPVLKNMSWQMYIIILLKNEEHIQKHVVTDIHHHFIGKMKNIYVIVMILCDVSQVRTNNYQTKYI